MPKLNATHDPDRRSWVESANQADTDFPIQNLPFGIFQDNNGIRGGVAIGDKAFDLTAGVDTGLFTSRAAEAAKAAAGPTLNPLMALGNEAASALRARLSDLLRTDSPDLDRIKTLSNKLLLDRNSVEMKLPAKVGAFTDFLCSESHTRRMSPAGTLPPAFKSLPIAYNSRASSVRVSGEPIHRPHGQYKDADGVVRFGPEPAQDYELELGIFIGPGNPIGAPIPIHDAGRHIFGYCLLNDWSARSIQYWESTPLGPFLSKSLSTTISPWVVTAEALAPFRVAAPSREPEDKLLDYLLFSEDQAEGGIDIELEAYLATEKMRAAGKAPERVVRTNYRNIYWTFAQMVAHHSSNGCNLQSGDILASGTISGPTNESRACIAEITRRGDPPIALSNGETRAWLHNGDEVIFRGRASREGYASIGFGECRGTLLPAIKWPASA